MNGDLAIDLARAALCVAAIAAAPSALAQQPPAHEHERAAPAEARDPNAYSGGFEYTDMPGQERTDRLAVRSVLVEQLELGPRARGDGAAWDVQAWHGPDERKLWVRTEGSVVDGELGPETSGEVLRWRAFSPFWATQIGIRQDFGPGARTYAAAGVQGLAPYWFDVEATLYAGEGGSWAARLKASYDLLFTNRLILSPEIEANFYSKAEPRRDLGTGAADSEVALRLRYEISRKLAPYVGVVWDRAHGNTADRLRAAAIQSARR